MISNNLSVIFDLDGTLCDDSHRMRFIHEIEKTDKDFKEKISKLWDEYHSLSINDPPIPLTCDILKSLNELGYITIILTGRDEQYSDITKSWLDKYSLAFDDIYMRPNGDHRSSAELKRDIYLNSIVKNNHVMGVFEDRKNVCDMWRDLGLQVYQTKEGNY